MCYLNARKQRIDLNTKMSDEYSLWKPKKSWSK